MPRRSGKAYIGTSGFSYDKWLGMFYPEDVDRKKLLVFYAEHFNSVEINQSFYSLPTERMISKWLDETPSDFKLVLKISRYITHVKKLLDPAQGVEKFLNAVKGASIRKSPLLLQLPPQLKPHYERLDKVLSEFHSQGEGRWKIALECRRDDWYGTELNDLLDRHKASLVIHDMPRGRNDRPNPCANFIYIRYHGPTGDYGGRYGKRGLKKDAERIRGWLGEGKSVYAYFNNDRDGYAPMDALLLKELIGE